MKHMDLPKLPVIIRKPSVDKRHIRQTIESLPCYILALLSFVVNLYFYCTFSNNNNKLDYK